MFSHRSTHMANVFYLGNAEFRKKDWGHSVPICWTFWRNVRDVKTVYLFAQKKLLFFIYLCLIVYYGAHYSLVFKTLVYKPEGHGFETRWSEILNLSNPSGLIRPWGLLSL
jgi:hypothetical protein